MKNKNGSLLLVMMMIALFIVGCSKEDSSDGESTTGGGELKIALNSQPPTLDQPMSTASTTRDVSRLIFETLVTTDSKYQAVPMLAESIDVSDDSKTYTFHLRKGVKFHNGKEMIAEDVLASMERWLEKSSITGSIFEGATWGAKDDNTVVLQLVDPSSLILDTLASSKQSAAIMPKEIVETATDKGITEYIGTGPFKFVEWKQDQYIHFTKYDAYQAVEAKTDGLAGKKEALVDDIYFYIVKDMATRLAGLQTGEYDFAFGIPFDNYEQLQSDPNLEAIIAPSANDLLAFNKVEGLASDLKMRQVINTALDMDEIMLAAFRNKDLYWLDSGYMDVSLSNWASKAGSEYYNQNDPEKAKRMLEEMGYDGEEFKIMTTRDFDHLYNIGVVIQEQLKQIGINATLEIVDWPTALDLQQNNTDAWDAFVTSSQIVSTPPQLIVLSPTWGGGFDDPKVTEAMKSIEAAPSLEEAQAQWDELQLYAWEELLPIVQLGGNNSLNGINKKVQGITNSSGPIFWNVKLAE